ncbi:MAG: acyl--CoA ligase [Alphaproteobacteria bacterium]|nr:acyl--CoA ligase [Alphaproteobacteria bacterium]
MAFETRLTPAMAERFRSAGLWGDTTFADLLASRVAAHPQKFAIVDGEHRVTYAALAHGIDRVADRLARLGIGAGDVVAIQIPNWREFAFVFFALERVGAVAVTVSVDFRFRELAYMMRCAGAKGFVCCGTLRGFDHLLMADDLRAVVPTLQVVATVRAPQRAGMVSLDDAVDGAGPPHGFVPFRQDADTVMRMAFTSGTTGDPKGVMHSHNTTLAACRILNDDIGLGADERMMIWLPLGLNWGFLTLVQALIAGATAVLLERFRAGEGLDLLERERCTFVPTAPASLTAILQEPDLGRRDLSALRMVVSGGASAPVETIRAWRAACPSEFLELYGMLETGYHSYTRPGDDPEAVAGSVGRRASHMGLRLVDADLRDVGEGEEGEICCDGPSVHLGYHDNPRANAEAFAAAGWFRTGDLGFLDRAGNLRISGRVKEMINRGGKKFFPREIEEVLYAHPKVLYVAMVGLPDPRLGERNCLCVVPKPDLSPPTLDELLAFIAGDFATYKLPERVEVFEQLPFTPTGKIQRHALVRAVMERDAARSAA